MKLGPIAMLLVQLTTQSPEIVETKKLDIVGELNGKPGAEIVMYRGGPEKPDIDDHYDMTLRPGEKYNTVTIYKVLDGPEAPYTELTISGHLMYARLIRGFQWQGPYIEHMCFTDLTEDGVPDVLLVSPGHRNGKVISYDTDKGQYRMLKLVVVPDEVKKF